MAKSALYSCRACGASLRGWFGRCPSCEAWNTVEEVEPAASGRKPRISTAETSRPIASTEAATAIADARRLPSGVAEVDRVLGGGLVPGSLTLLGGAPGVGKSTLLLQVAHGVACEGRTVLYASGEESVSQIAGRSERLGTHHPSLYFAAETRIEAIEKATRDTAPQLLIVDSVQTVWSEAEEGLPGNVSQVRAVAGHLLTLAKSTGTAVIVVGHVTKDGQLAGPRLLEHLVDVVLSFEGEADRATRLLRASKNRFGSTEELGVFEMWGRGLREVANASEAFLDERGEQTFGACVGATLGGSRVFLVEIQALLAQSFGGSPRRTAVGVDPSRVAMLLAVLDQHGGRFLLDHEVFVNVAGGLRLTEPASDLPTLLALASAQSRKPIPADLAAFGEVGLTGELRSCPRTEARLMEAKRLGFRRVLCPARRKNQGELPDLGIERLECRTVAQALEHAG